MLEGSSSGLGIYCRFSNFSVNTFLPNAQRAILGAIPGRSQGSMLATVTFNTFHLGGVDTSMHRYNATV